MSYIPSELKEQNVKFKLIQLTPLDILGSQKIVEQEIGSFFANYATYGGTERELNGKYVIEDTGYIVTSYRPDITSSCKLVRVIDNAEFEIINEPENIKMRNVALKFKVRRLKGKF